MEFLELTQWVTLVLTFFFIVRKSQREKEREAKAGVVSFEEIRQEKIIKMFLSFDLETQLNIVESLPKKRYSFSADYSKVQSGFLALLTVHREKLNPSIKRALLANVNKLAKTIAKS